MPVSISSTAWEEGEDVPTQEQHVLEFLKNDPENAYNIRELAEEIYDINWTGYEEQHREMKRKRSEGENINQDKYVDYPSVPYIVETEILKTKIQFLIEKKLVETKYVDASKFGPEVPDEYDQITAYSYNQISQ